MRFFVLFSMSLALSCPLHAARQYHVDCTAEDVLDTSFFEESLSVEEYPAVQLARESDGSHTAWFGSSLYSEADGDSITPQNAAGFDRIYRITPSHQLEEFLLVVTGSPMNRTGRLMGRTRESTAEAFCAFSLIAPLKCK